MFGSGAEFDDSKYDILPKEQDIYKIVPNTLGGLVKSIIAKRINSLSTPKCNYLRFFGGFGYNEAENRFIKCGLLNIIDGKPITIHQNRWFDFIYIDDIVTIVKYVLENDRPIDINCVYRDKKTLYDIANIMLQVTQSDVSIITEKQTMGLNYIGDGTRLHHLGIPLLGLKNGIQHTYEAILNE